MDKRLEQLNELAGSVYTSMIKLVNFWNAKGNEDLDEIISKNYPFQADFWEISEEVGGWMVSIHNETNKLDVKDQVLGLALGTFLSYYPEDCSHQDILQAMEKDENTVDGCEMDITPWEPFQYWSMSDIAEQVDLLYRGIVDLLKTDED